MKIEVQAVMLFISELNGFMNSEFEKTVEGKISHGQACYVQNELHTLNLSDEDDRKEVHENIWLQRLYDELDTYFGIINMPIMRQLSLDTESYRENTYKWTVPIELDASASMLQYEGILMNDQRLCDNTNVIGSHLKDPWSLKGMVRKMLKTAATPMLYGSSQDATSLWDDAKFKYTSADIKAYANEMQNGAFGLANALKNFIIDNSNPKEEMEVHIWNEKFTIRCNRYKNVGEQTYTYEVFDTLTNTVRVIKHTDTKKVADLDQFRRYFMTLLVHNLDSQVANTVIQKVMNKYGWGIPIHDAFIVSPAAAYDVRKWYAEELDKIHANRETILNNYFASIGIDKFTARQEFEELQAKVTPIVGEFKCSLMALK